MSKNVSNNNNAAMLLMSYLETSEMSNISIKDQRQHCTE